MSSAISRERKMHLLIWLSCLDLGAVPVISLLWYVCFYSLSIRIKSIYRASSCILSKTSRYQMHPGALNYPFSLTQDTNDKYLFLYLKLFPAHGFFFSLLLYISLSKLMHNVYDFQIQALYSLDFGRDSNIF